MKQLEIIIWFLHIKKPEHFSGPGIYFFYKNAYS